MDEEESVIDGKNVRSQERKGLSSYTHIIFYLFE